MSHEACNPAAPSLARRRRARGRLLAVALAVLVPVPAAAGGSEAPSLAQRLAGTWQSLEDSASRRSFAPDGRTHSRYAGELMAQGRYALTRRCGDRTADGPAPLLSVKLAGEAEAYCYALDRLDAERLHLIYLPRGNLLRYRRVGE